MKNLEELRIVHAKMDILLQILDIITKMINNIETPQEDISKLSIVLEKTKVLYENEVENFRAINV